MPSFESFIVEEFIQSAADRGAQSILLIRMYARIMNVSIDEATQEYARLTVTAADAERARIQINLNFPSDES